MRRIFTLGLGVLTLVGALLVASPREASARRYYYAAPYYVAPYYAYRAPRYYRAPVVAPYPYVRTWGGWTSGAPIYAPPGMFFSY